MTPLLSTAYWPNLHYFYYVLNADAVIIEQFENYHKQSYRNRTQILSANGRLDLSIPVKNNATKTLCKDLKISYAENWQLRHWRAITSAYNNSPYFDFFEEEIGYFYTRRFETLMEYNLQQLQRILKILRQQREIRLTEKFEKEMDPEIPDLRSLIHPKINFREDRVPGNLLEKPYYQTFENKFSFYPNLSILDLLFNKGLETTDYLRSSEKKSI